MNRKLIFLDIDGTLTEPGKNVPPASALDAIRKARENGHLVLLCSGRNYAMLSPLLAYGFDGAVCSAGGYVLAGDTVVYDCPMTPDQQQCALRVFEENGIFRTIESRDGSYTDEGFKRFLEQSGGAGSELARWREQLENSLGIRPMAEYNGAPIYKIVFMSPGRKNLDAPMQALQAEFDFCIQDEDESGIVNGELINKKFNKGTAVRLLSAHYGIPMEDTIAFGDSMNDMEMIEAAGLGLCMENGTAALKAIADGVCPAVSEDGLARAFQKIGLLDEAAKTH